MRSPGRIRALFWLWPFIGLGVALVLLFMVNGGAFIPWTLVGLGVVVISFPAWYAALYSKRSAGGPYRTNRARRKSLCGTFPIRG